MTIYGWDMSHYDAPSIGTARSEGITFITHKAGGDSSSGDGELATWWSAVKGIPDDNFLLGAYWVPRPDLYPSASGEADRFLAVLDSRCPGWRNRDAFILQVDAEIWNGNAATAPTLSWLKAFCNRLVYKAATYRPIVYASTGQYGNKLTGLGFPLWNARYPYSVQEGFKAAYARAGGDSGKGWGSYSGQVPAVWQYTSSATIGGQTTCDANAFRGTLDQLKDLVTPMTAVDLTPDAVQAVLNGIYRDLKNPASGIAQQLEARVLDALNIPLEYTGAAGQRIEDRGWSEVSPWTLLQYLFEGVASGTVALAESTPDNTVVASASLMARLARIEDKLGITAAPADPPPAS